MKIDAKKIWNTLKMPLLSIFVAFIVGAILIIMTGNSPIEAYAALLRGSLGSPQALSQTINRCMPIIFSGLAVAFAFQCKSLNIGGEGQIAFGVFGAALAGIYIEGLPTFIHIPVILIVAFIFGGAWAIIPAALKVKKDVNTVISTIMMNYVGIALVSFLIKTYFRADAGDFVAMLPIQDSGLLPFIQFGSFRVNSGIIIAIIAAIIMQFVLDKTVLGYEIKAVGQNPSAARTNGINANRNTFIALIISGGLAALAGAIDLMSNMFGKLYDGYAPGYGFDGIPIALLAKSNPLGVLLTSFLFSVLRTGATTMQTSVGVPRTIVDAMQGVIILFIAAEYIFTMYKSRAKKRGANV